MTKYIAITVLSVVVTPGVAKTPLTAGKRPVTKEIQPGTILVIDDADEAAGLIASGAIRKATKDDTKTTHVENLTDLSEEQTQAAAVEQARVNQEAEAENKRREVAAQAALDQGAGASPKPKAAAKANAAAGKPASSAKEAIAADAQNGDTGAAGTGGNKDGTGTNAGANTTADADNNAAGTDDGGLV